MAPIVPVSPSGSPAVCLVRASRLAAEAGVTAATASSHLRKLLDGGLLSVEDHGRHRYYRLADDRVGHLLEVLTQLSPPRAVHSLRQGTRARALREARTCYDHLAGALGSGLLARFVELDWVRPTPADRAVTITAAGRTGLLAALDLDPPGCCV